MSEMNSDAHNCAPRNPKIWPKRHRTLHNNNRELFTEMVMAVDVMDMRIETEIKMEVKS